MAEQVRQSSHLMAWSGAGGRIGVGWDLPSTPVGLNLAAISPMTHICAISDMHIHMAAVSTIVYVFVYTIADF